MRGTRLHRTFALTVPSWASKGSNKRSNMIKMLKISGQRWSKLLHVSQILLWSVFDRRRSLLWRYEKIWEALLLWIQRGSCFGAAPEEEALLSCPLLPNGDRTGSDSSCVAVWTGPTCPRPICCCYRRPRYKEDLPAQDTSTSKNVAWIQYGKVSSSHPQSRR